MRYLLTIPGRLPGLNEYINAERSNKHKAAQMKRQAQETIGWHIKSQLPGVKIEKPVTMIYRWYEANRRRDKDNIAFARKFIQDSLVEMRVLKNDGWDEISGFVDEFAVDTANPRIEIEIMEAE